jgi:hypothetical protein
MVTKTCGRCGRLKELSEFHRRGAGYQAWCKTSRKKYDAAYFRAERSRVMATKRKRWKQLVDWYNELKESKPCADCGQHFRHAAMTWDHLPGREKRTNVSNLRRISRRAVLREIEKCELVWANCHAVRS